MGPNVGLAAFKRYLPFVCMGIFIIIYLRDYRPRFDTIAKTQVERKQIENIAETNIGAGNSVSRNGVSAYQPSHIVIPRYPSEPVIQWKSDLKIFTAKGEISYVEADEKVFRPLGYRILEANLIPSLGFIDEPSCDQVFTSWLSGSKSQDEARTPPRDIPEKLLNNYTLNGYSDLLRDYMDNHSGGGSAHWQGIEQLVQGDPRKNPRNYNEGLGMYHAMHSVGLKDQFGFVVGSLTPWVEVYALQNGARKLLTLEYKNIKISGTNLISYMHPVKMAEEYQKHIGLYDFAASFSSIEHSGLGRFGDALDPHGDIREVLKTRCMLKKGGLFFLGFPVGQDTVHFNLHRIYGRLRLAILFAGFKLESAFWDDNVQPFELNEKTLGKQIRPGEYMQLAFVLRKI